MLVDKNKVDAFNNLKNTDFRTNEQFLKENLFINQIITNPEIYKFSTYLLYNIIQKAKKVKLDYSIIKHIIDSWILETSNNKKIIGKVGYKCNYENNCDYIINITNFNEFFKSIGILLSCVYANLILIIGTYDTTGLIFC